MMRTCTCVLMMTLLVSCGGGGNSNGSTAELPPDVLPPNNLRYNVLDKAAVKSNGSTLNLTLTGVAKLSLSPSAVDLGETVTLTKLDSQAHQEIFDESKAGDSDEITAPYQVQISVGKKLPTNTVSIVLTIPSELVKGTNTGRYVRVYGYAETGSDVEEPSPTIVRLPTTAGTTIDTVTVEIPVEVFILNENTREVEADLFIASSRKDIQTTSLTALDSRAYPLAVDESVMCAADLLAPPARPPLVAGDRFSLNRTILVKGVLQSRPHYGQDITVVEGTPIYAAADGVVTKVTTEHCTLTKIFAHLAKIKNMSKPQCFNKNELPLCFSDATCKNVLIGFGQYVEVRHKVFGNDSGLSKYAHLKLGSATVRVGDPVNAGTLLALSGNTGGSTGPHLHFEGRDAGDKARNPIICLAPTIRLVESFFAVPKASPDAGPTPHECCSFFRLELPVETNISALASFNASLQLGTGVWETGAVFTPGSDNPSAYINWYGTTFRESNPETNSSRMIWGMSVHHGGQFDPSLRKSNVRTTFELQSDAADPFTSQTKKVKSNRITLDVGL